jgi:acyl-homoserine lactone acylase PvdQ
MAKERIMRLTVRVSLWALVALLLASCGQQTLPGEGEDYGKLVVYRDSWGVPHIYAPSLQAGCYAQAWTQAEDRPEELLKNLLRGLGRLARVDGPAALDSDMIALYWDHYETAKRNLQDEETIDEGVQACLRAFAQGVNDYYSAHPEDMPDWWVDGPVDEYMVVAFGRQFLYSWSVGSGFGDLRRGGISPGLNMHPRASNQFAVSPARSAEGGPILAIDPHLPWWGGSRFWEFRIHAGSLVGSGVTVPGFPGIGLGHNQDLAWAMTTGGPDTADIYELTLNSEGTQYRYDGKWRPLENREVALQVAGEEPQTLTILSSHHGPVVASKDGKAYAMKMAYAEEVNATGAWLRLNLGTDYKAAVEALGTQQFFPQNVMVADTSGNIYYQRTGKVPVRPQGYDFSKPVDGSTSKTEWQGFHPTSELVQQLNPDQGYMQNCNVPPEVMFAGNTPKPSDYPEYIYSDRSYGPLSAWSNRRSSRAVELLENDSSVSAEEAIAVIMDVKPFDVDRWVSALKSANEGQGRDYADDAIFQAGLQDILGWSGELKKDSSAALKYYYWRMKLVEMLGVRRVRSMIELLENPLGPMGNAKEKPQLAANELQELVAAFDAGMKQMEEDLGTVDAVYGDVFRVGRAGVSWPVGGGDQSILGLDTLRSVGFQEEQKDHTRWGFNGQSATQVVVLEKPIRSWSAVPIGQSDRLSSDHFRDQAEGLFSPRQLKSNWWTPEELVPHIVTRTVLEKPTKTQ